MNETARNENEVESTYNVGGEQSELVLWSVVEIMMYLNNIFNDAYNCHADATADSSTQPSFRAAEFP